jgi:DNA-directed RNA polymerase specialized sigma24 family protein
MTAHEAKRYLRQVRTIDRRIDREEEQVERLRAKLEAGRMSSVTGMPRGGVSDWTDTVHALVALEQRLNARTREMCAIKIAAVDAVDRVADARCRELLTLYYLHGHTWQQVADAMHLDLRWVYRLHGRALREVAVQLDGAI